MTVHALDLAARSHVGRVRTHNEDAWVALARQGVVVVADGMGGHSAGEVASRLAVDRIAAALADLQERDFADEIDSLMQVGQALEQANRAVVESAHSDPRLAGMGTTVVAALFRNERIFFAHVGDSRLYRLRGGRLRRLTRDHSLVQQLLDQGLFRNRAEARMAGVGDNVLIRSIGVDGQVEVDVGDAPLHPGDLFLLCTDGLCGKVPDKVLGELLRQPGDLEQLAERLQQAGLDAGGTDNITLVLVRPRV